MTAGLAARGQSGLPLARVPGNARRGQPQGKRHREETSTSRTKVRLRIGVVKVKRWGKSPPRDWQQDRHGKPHPEQCQIGASRGVRSPRKRGYRPQGCQRPRGPGWQLDRRGDTVGRGMVIHGRKPRTESGLQALRAHFPSGCYRRFFLEDSKPSELALSRLTLPPARIKGGLQGFHRGASGFPMQRKRPWQSPPPSRSA